MNKTFLYGALCISCTTISCPLILENNTETDVIFVDPQGTSAVYLQPGQMQKIDPSLSPLWYYFPLRLFKKETLYVYTPDETHQFNLTYILTEQYCAPEIKHLSMQDIVALIANPSKRFTVAAVEKKTKEHNTKDHAH